MATHQPCSVVLSCADDRLIIQAVEQSKASALASGQLQMPILLEEFGYKLDDEFARRLGVAMLNLLALGIPDLKRHMQVTLAPLSGDPASGQPWRALVPVPQEIADFCHYFRVRANDILNCIEHRSSHRGADMKTRAPDHATRSATSEARLHHQQSIIVPLPRHARVVVVEGAAQLAFADSTLDWLGEAAPAVRITLQTGETYVVERSCHATLYGAKAGMTVIHLEAPAVPSLLARLQAWATRINGTRRRDPA